MARAPYSRNTLDCIRMLTAGGRTVSNIAHTLEWTPDELTRVAARHGIELIHDPVPAASVSPSPAPEKPSRKKQADDRRCVGPSRIRLIGGSHPRTGYKNIALSVSAMRAVDKIVKEDGFAATSILGVTVDYLCRHGKLRALFDEAIAEANRVGSLTT